MKTSDEGLRLNKSFEGYHRKLESDVHVHTQNFAAMLKLAGG